LVENKVKIKTIFSKKFKIYKNLLNKPFQFYITFLYTCTIYKQSQTLSLRSSPALRLSTYFICATSSSVLSDCMVMFFTILSYCLQMLRLNFSLVTMILSTILFTRCRDLSTIHWLKFKKKEFYFILSILILFHKIWINEWTNKRMNEKMNEANEWMNGGPRSKKYHIHVVSHTCSLFSYKYWHIQTWLWCQNFLIIIKN
jgi:hypothetical protein